VKVRFIQKDDFCKKDSPYSFELVTKDRSYHFSCSLIKDRDMWVSALTDILLHYTKPLVKASGVQIFHTNYEWEKYFAEIKQLCTPRDDMRRSSSQIEKLKEESQLASPYQDTNKKSKKRLPSATR